MKHTASIEKNIVSIHGKDYMTVAGRLQMALNAQKKISITTEVLPISNQVVVRATVTTDKGTFTGISAANPTKLIEKQSPFEVAETSAVGRALGFAGFGSVESIASADEVIKAEKATLESSQKDEKDEDSVCTCGTTGKYHALDCPARRVITVSG